MVTKADIQAGFELLGIVGSKVLIHSSLSSFGKVAGGTRTVLNAVTENFATILMPAFCWDSNTAPLDDDRPAQNGCDYTFYSGWNKPLKRFIVAEAGIEKSMGVICRDFISLPGVQRSNHAWHSWAAYGEEAEKLVENHSWGQTSTPILKMAEAGGQLLLMGTSLTSCTAIHTAEEQAGREPFIRWMVDESGQIRQVRASGCAKGFDKLLPHCKHLFKETMVGSCRMLTTPLRPFIDQVAAIITANPEITRCSPSCIRCRDAILGGPAGVGGEL